MAEKTKSAATSAGTATVHDQKLNRGEGGELHQTTLHQTTNVKAAVLTTGQGGPVTDDQNSLKVAVAADDLDEGCIAIASAKDAKSLVKSLAKLRVRDASPTLP